MNHKALCCSALISCGGPALPVADIPTPKAELPALTASFGRLDDQGRWLVVDRIVLATTTRFGWRAVLPCTGPIEFVETLELPAPGDWAADEGAANPTKVSQDRRTAVTHDYAACVSGKVEHLWGVSEADPPGLWKLRVEIAGYQPRTWTIRFETPPQP
jgi:hypothetical protein